MIFLTNFRFPPPLFVSKSTPPMVSSPCAKSPGTVSGPTKANEKMHARYLVGSFCSSLCRENLVTCRSFAHDDQHRPVLYVYIYQTWPFGQRGNPGTTHGSSYVRHFAWSAGLPGYTSYIIYHIFVKYIECVL